MRIQKKLLSGLLACALALGAAAFPADAAAEETGRVYADVPADAWYAEAAYWCLENGLMYGVSEEPFLFEPDFTMNRATLATVLYRMSGSPEVSDLDNPFRDVKAGAWYTDAVLWAYASDLMGGYGDGIFGPMDKVNRGHIVTTLWRMAGRPDPVWTAADYTDISQTPEWAVVAAVWSHENGILPEREDGSFSCKAEVPRCEIAPTLMNYDGYVNPPPPTIEEQFVSAFGYLPTSREKRLSTYIPASFRLAAMNPDGTPGVLMPQAETDPETGKVIQPDYLADIPEGEEVPLRYMTYQSAPYTVGIDVSSHQKDIDWRAVAASGVQFAMIRVGYRGYSVGSINADAWFRQNIEGALAAGLEVGVYFYSQATTIAEALEEAEYTLNAIRGYNITYPVVFDWESGNSNYRTWDIHLNHPETVALCAVAFCETVKKAGYIPAMYGSRNKLRKLDMGVLADYPVWMAHYTAYQVPSDYEGGYDMWQYSSKWTVPGVNGNCDVDICMTNWTQWRLANGYPAAP